MSTAVFVERPTVGAFPGQSQAAAPAPNFCVVPRCELKFEKCAEGCKIYCKCEDEVSCATLQNLCKILAGGLCSCCCTWNGMTVCQCNLCCGACTCECTKDGVCITCCSGDKACCEIIQKCCDCLATCCKNGCCCTISLGGTPICCGAC